MSYEHFHAREGPMLTDRTRPRPWCAQTKEAANISAYRRIGLPANPPRAYQAELMAQISPADDSDKDGFASELHACAGSIT